MIESTETIFEGFDCIQLTNGLITIWITTEVGPRILGLTYRERANILAVLPDLRLPVQGAKEYSVRGGHRLWYAPEIPKNTYIADDHPVKVSQTKNGLKLVQEVDNATGIQKSWQVKLDEKEAQVRIIHQLSNLGEREFELAPWAITQLRAGGTAVIPLQVDHDDEYGLQPNRQIVLWPYTELNSPNLQLRDKKIVVQAKILKGALKVGAPNPIGWLAYELDGFLFVKKTDYQTGARYLDRGASSQIYCNRDFIELETLGPVVELAPNESVDHQETWQVFPEDDWPAEVKELIETSEVDPTSEVSN